MSYQFGNIFVQAMENQKRLATQRQQFDQQMTMDQQRFDEGRRQFDVSSRQTDQQIGYQGRATAAQERGVEIQGQDHDFRVGERDRSLISPDVWNKFDERVNFEQPRTAAEGETFLRLLNEQDRIAALQQQGQRIVTNTITGDQRVIGQNEQPKENESFDPGVTMSIKDQTAHTEAVAGIASDLGSAARDITPGNIDRELDRFEGVFKKINTAGIDRLTQEDITRLQLEPAMYNLNILSQKLNPDGGDKDFIKQIGGKQRAVEYRRKVDRIINKATQRGVQESVGMYHPDHKPGFFERAVNPGTFGASAGPDATEAFRQMMGRDSLLDLEKTPRR